MSETLMRQWQMLRLIPRHPASITTTELQFRLADEGFAAHQRTLQRDLVQLEAIYPLACNDQSRPFAWSWMADADIIDVPGMDSHTALAFVLANQHLEHMLPTTTLAHLGPHFRTARNVLDHIQAQRGIPAWVDKVRVIHRGPALFPAEILPNVQQQVYIHRHNHGDV